MTIRMSIYLAFFTRNGSKKCPMR